MSYRAHGIELDPLTSGAPSPYDPDNRYFFAPDEATSPDPRAQSFPEDTTPRDQYMRQPSDSSQQPILNDPPPPQQQSIFRRTGTNLTRHPEMSERWSTGIHWYVPTSMVVVFLFGCFGAITHHLFYSFLHDTRAENQLTINRFGTALAFFTKATLVGAVVLSYRYTPAGVFGPRAVWTDARQATCMEHAARKVRFDPRHGRHVFGD